LNTTGRHVLAEYYGCAPEILDDPGRIGELLNAAARAAGATVVQSVVHTFSPQGVTGVVVVEESHFSIHTWPEHGYAAVDAFTCGDCRPERVTGLLARGLGALTCEVMVMRRGAGRPGASIEVVRHAAERVEPTAGRGLEHGDQGRYERSMAR
jgi:S-adenosylmethionine decarboxylase proenzyme